MIPSAVRTALAGIAAASIFAAAAEPYIPASDAQVLERGLPRRTINEPSTATDLTDAVRRAGLEVSEGQRRADPRHFGRAQAILRPWWDASDAPASVLLLRATIRQSLHEFAEARGDLQRLVARDPRNAQAWLLLATIDQVTGALDSARLRCDQLRSLASPLVVATCAAGVDGVRGDAAGAIERLTTLLDRPGPDPAGVVGWARSVQGELARRAGDETLATKAFVAVLAADPDDIYTRAAYADQLLDLGAPEAALQLVRGRRQADALLLREAIAARACAAPDAVEVATRMRERIAAAREGGDRTHLREQARFMLEVEGDATAALALALENWGQQKEPADVRIALESAVAAGKPRAVREVVEWTRRNRLQDPRIATLVDRLQRT